MTNALATAALIVGIVGFVTGGLALRTLGRLRRSVALLSRGTSGRETILDVAERHMAASDAVRRDIETVHHTVNTALRRVALVRYDAFDTLGGRLSFSLAIMDDQGNGITLTSIASHSDTRLYAKSLVQGIGEHALSPEEEQAVRAALAG